MGRIRNSPGVCVCTVFIVLYQINCAISANIPITDDLLNSEQAQPTDSGIIALEDNINRENESGDSSVPPQSSIRTTQVPLQIPETASVSALPTTTTRMYPDTSDNDLEIESVTAEQHETGSGYLSPENNVVPYNSEKNTSVSSEKNMELTEITNLPKDETGEETFEGTSTIAKATPKFTTEESEINKKSRHDDDFNEQDSDTRASSNIDKSNASDLLEKQDDNRWNMHAAKQSAERLDDLTSSTPANSKSDDLIVMTETPPNKDIKISDDTKQRKRHEDETPIQVHTTSKQVDDISSTHSSSSVPPGTTEGPRLDQSSYPDSRPSSIIESTEDIQVTSIDSPAIEISHSEHNTPSSSSGDIVEASTVGPVSVVSSETTEKPQPEYSSSMPSSTTVTAKGTIVSVSPDPIESSQSEHSSSTSSTESAKGTVTSISSPAAENPMQQESTTAQNKDIDLPSEGTDSTEKPIETEIPDFTSTSDATSTNLSDFSNDFPTTSESIPNGTTETPSVSSEDSSSSKSFLQELKIHTVMCLISLLLILLAVTVVFSLLLALFLVLKYSVLGLIRLCKKIKKCSSSSKCSRSDSDDFHNTGSLFPRNDLYVRPYNASELDSNLY